MNVENEYEETRTRLAPTVLRVSEQLTSGISMSAIAIDLERHKIGFLEFIHIIREATDVGIAELKGFGKWMRDEGWNLRAAEIDEYSRKLKIHERVGDDHRTP